MNVFSAIVDPTRREILEMLAKDGPLSATEIGEKFRISPPAISQHLKVLREANLVKMDKRAQQHMYQINPQAMLELSGWANRMTQLWSQRFDALDAILEVEKKKHSSQ